MSNKVFKPGDIITTEDGQKLECVTVFTRESFYPEDQRVYYTFVIVDEERSS